MTYEQHTQQLLEEGYTRVERDDRLLDILSGQTREKGVELWEKWEDEHVHFTRIRLPYGSKKIEYFSIPHQELGEALQTNQQLSLEDYRHLEPLGFEA